MAQYRVLITRRPKDACRTCREGVVQAAAPARLIAGGLPTERLVAQVLAAKYADHCPLHRQAQILARQGIAIDRSSLAFRVGHAAAEIKPLRRLMRQELLRSTKLFVDERTAPVLDPGRGRAKTGWFRVRAREDRPWRGRAPPAVVYSCAPELRPGPRRRTGDRAAPGLLRCCTGVLQTDAGACPRAARSADPGAACGKLADPKRGGGPATLAYCWAHWRRQWFDIAKSPPAPIAAEVLQRIAELCRIEAEIRGEEADQRRAVRQPNSKPLIDALKNRLEEMLRQVPGGSSIAQAIRCGFNQWAGNGPGCRAVSATAALRSTPTPSSVR